MFVAKALLFDLDGTLINSLAAVDRCWSAWALRHGMSPEEVLTKIHGRRSIDSIRLLRPDLDAAIEDAWLRSRESQDVEGVIPISGAPGLLASLGDVPYAFVTSGTSDVARARVAAVGYRVPPVCVFAEDVVSGKPAPDPYLLAASRLGQRPEDCLVFEDVPAGVASGKAAGMRVIGVATWQSPEALSSADAVVPNLIGIRVDQDSGSITVTIPSA